MLQNATSIVSMVVQIVTVLLAVSYPLIKVWGKVNVLEAELKEHTKKLEGMDSVLTRLTRIETLLEMLVKDRH